MQHVQLTRRHRRFERRQVMHPHRRQRPQAEHGHQRRAAEQQTHLDVFGHHDRLQPAQRRVGHREQRQHNDGVDHRHAEEAFKDFRRGEEADADVDQQRAEQANERQEGPGRRTVAAFHELGQRAHSRIDVEGGEEERQQDEGEAGHPLEIADHHALLGAARRQPHQMDGGDVGSEHRRPDGEPAQRFVGQEVLIGGGVPPEANPDAKGGNAEQIGGDDDDVNGGGGHGAGWLIWS